MEKVTTDHRGSTISDLPFYMPAPVSLPDSFPPQTTAFTIVVTTTQKQATENSNLDVSDAYKVTELNVFSCGRN